MSVERISGPALERLVKGDIEEEATCVVKFYSNECHLCHALKDQYEQISNHYDDIYFFAFNVDDHDELDKLLPVNGTPSIYLIKTGANKKMFNLPDPEEPDETTWYTFEYIKNFIDRMSR